MEVVILCQFTRLVFLLSREMTLLNTGSCIGEYTF